MQITQEMIDKAKAEADSLWQALLAIQAKYEPFRLEMEEVRRKWSQAHEEAQVLERLKNRESENGAAL